ncbi:Aste57867_3556 [Aphanomyces stellatus]|uniref:Aste57867_3556 protein n=1 Tax=Aphanomyces stellatus TaxID=120398 RepID=A0A485KFQ5_9STRA|nr:hypothetical protein As57867_003545 [Aphanomyces stellatus]VFT80719.1 Aste57867_3556 [Aphanomyces stellatus]
MNKAPSSAYLHKTLVSSIGDINVPAVVYMAVVHALALLALLHLAAARWHTLVFTGVLYHLSVLGVTAGAHRLWAHKSYKAHGIVRVFLMLCNSVAHQGSIFEWSQWHRLHHRFADSDLDPHNIHRGVFHAHMGWRLVHPTSEMTAALAKVPCDDLLLDWVVAFQHEFAPLLHPLLCFGLPTAAAMVLFHEDALVAFLVPGVLRHVLAMHAAWLVNSIGHIQGAKPYNPALCGCDNAFVSLVTLGDGYQNWHHQFPNDYAAAEKEWQFNPTKAFIDLCATFGLAGQRQRALHQWGQKKWVLRSRSPIVADEIRPVRYVNSGGILLPLPPRGAATAAE